MYLERDLLRMKAINLHYFFINYFYLFQKDSCRGNVKTRRSRHCRYCSAERTRHGAAFEPGTSLISKISMMSKVAQKGCNFWALQASVRYGEPYMTMRQQIAHKKAVEESIWCVSCTKRRHQIAPGTHQTMFKKRSKLERTIYLFFYYFLYKFDDRFGSGWHLIQFIILETVPRIH